jgi:hypothetical protein
MSCGAVRGAPRLCTCPAVRQRSRRACSAIVNNDTGGTFIFTAPQWRLFPGVNTGDGCASTSRRPQTHTNAHHLSRSKSTRRPAGTSGRSSSRATHRRQCSRLRAADAVAPATPGCPSGTPPIPRHSHHFTGRGSRAHFPAETPRLGLGGRAPNCLDRLASECLQSLVVRAARDQSTTTKEICAPHLGRRPLDT